MSLATALLRADDLFRMPRDGWRYELVEGVLHRMPPPGFDPGRHAYFPGAPDFLVEVLSPSDTYSEVEKKVARWLGAGAQMVVLADSSQALLFVHRPGRPAEILSGNDTLDASGVVPGWKIRVGEIFEAEGRD